MSGSQSIQSRLFEPNSGHGNVVLNFLQCADQEFAFYAKAFHRSGKRLAEYMFSLPSYNDLDACPIIFVYRHSLELYLKAIARIGQDILKLKSSSLEISDKELMGHKLSNFLPLVEKVFSEVGWQWELEEEGIQSLKEVGLLLNDFDLIDSGSYTFRYPLDTKGQPSVPHNFKFNVPNFCSKMDSLLDSFEATALGLTHEREVLMEEAFNLLNTPSD